MKLLDYIKRSINKFAADFLPQVVYEIVKGVLALLGLFLLGLLLPANTTVGSFLKKKFSTSIIEFGILVLCIICITFFCSSLIFKRKIKKIQTDNYTDELTGLLNHKALKEKLAQITIETKKSNQPLSLILMDIDDFKRFNTQYGYKKADEIVAKLGQILKRDSRITDITFRQHLKGDEFIILAINTDIEGATIAADRKRNVISNTIFTVSDDPQSFHISVCCGVTLFDPVADSIDTFLGRGTKAMLIAKLKEHKNTTQSLV